MAGPDPGKPGRRRDDYWYDYERWRLERRGGRWPLTLGSSTRLGCGWWLVASVVAASVPIIAALAA